MSQPLENTLCQLLAGRGLTLAAAESCTGGLVAHRLTNVPGSSRYFLGSVVVYSERLKESLLGVSAETIRRHTVYSAEVALEMAQGVRRITGADIGVGITGIAGPDGGTADKPVGLVYVAVAGDGTHHVERFEFRGERPEIKEQASEQALILVERSLQQR